MSIRRIYREPIETSRHLQLKQACLDYFTASEKLMKRPSRKLALQARRALLKMKKVIKFRRQELMTLYSDVQNIGREPLYGVHDKHSRSVNRKINKKTNNKEEEESYARN